MPANRKIFLFFFLIWIAVWFIFLFKVNKKGDYEKLLYLYSHNDIEKRRYLTGEDLYDFFVFCKGAMSAKATYNIFGLDETREVTVRYLLWPDRRELKNPDFLIVYGNPQFTQNGYRLVQDFKNKGILLAREDTKK